MRNMLARVAPYLQWRLAQWLAGGLFAFAFAPYFFWPAFIVALLIYYHGLRTAPTRRSATVRSFWFGYGFSIAGTYWIAFSLLVDADKFAWLLPFSVLGLSAVMALWWALQGLVYARLRRTHLLHDAVLFASVVAAIEYAKSFGMFGFPWNLNGYAFVDFLPLAQFASVAGVYGIGWVVLCMVALLYHVRTSPRSFVVACGLFVVLVGWGAYRLQTPVEDSAVMARLVQPNIAQSMKWNQDAARDTLATLGTMSVHGGGVGSPDLVVWPETAIPYTLSTDVDWQGLTSRLLPKGASLVTGTVREETGALYNSIVFVHDGKLAATYDKHQLVPFGEFVPLRDVLPLDKITPGAQDFSKGTGAKTVTLADGLPRFSPLVCYEAVFSHLAVAGDARPDAIINLTNDAWFGNSPGPYQHLAMARMRAIEQGLPLIRVANTGISAVIDPHGKFLAFLPLEQAGVIDRKIPLSIISPIYTRYGSIWMLLVVAVLMHAAFTTMRRKD